jgi:hypothetical protein
VLALAFALVFGIGRLLGGGDGGAAAGSESASPVGSTPRTAATTTTPSAPMSIPPSVSATPGPAGTGSGKQRKAALAAPEGPCKDSDVLVTPSLTGAHAGGEVEVVLELTTVEEAACTWEVSPDSVFLSITTEDGPVWSTQDCPDAVPTQAVVPRRDKADKVTVVWSGRESDDSCSASAPWVLQGVYTATAVARGSVTPVDVGFVLGNAVRPTKTETPTPTPTPTRTPTATPSGGSGGHGGAGGAGGATSR